MDPVDWRVCVCVCAKLVFRLSETLLLPLQKNLGRVFGGIKSACGFGETHSLGYPHIIGFFSYGKTLGRVFGGIKSPCGNGDTHSLVSVSNPGLEPGVSGVRRPRASPLGNLTTVGHLAKVSPDLGLHFQTQKHVF